MRASLDDAAFWLDDSDSVGDLESLFSSNAVELVLVPHSDASSAGVPPSPFIRPSLCGSDEISKEEWALRVDLAAAYRLLHLFGWDDLIYGHSTVRVPSCSPDAPAHFLINPFGLHYSEITASSLVKVDVNGEIVHPGSTKFGINKAGYVLHSAIHMGREDLQAVIHSHAAVATALSCVEGNLLFELSQTAQVVGGSG